MSSQVRPQIAVPQGPTSMHSERSLSGSPSLSRAKQAGNQRIGPYLLGKTLGVGSTGRVKLGTHAETMQKVAIKIIPKDMLTQNKDGSPLTPEKRAAMEKKMEREITIMKLIQHPNIMQLHDVYETDKELFLVLEHVEGGELFDYLVKTGRLPEPEALNFFQQIIYGVDFCHRHLIAHRDLKPENLLLDKDMNIKIADFGMASLQVTGKMLETSCGSPHYASPEIIKGIKYDGGPADIWSCGIILYALLTGNLPFDDENIRRLLSKVKTGVYVMPDFISESAKDLIRRMLVVEPENRITMNEIMQHPWFRSQHTRAVGWLPGALDDRKILSSIVHLSDLDTEIITSLRLLGWGTDEEIAASVMRKEPCLQKVFYFLLLKRKLEQIENYDASKDEIWFQEGGPRRRTSSFASLASSSRMELFKSSDSIDKKRSRDELNVNTGNNNYSRSREELSPTAETSETTVCPSRTVVSDTTQIPNTSATTIIPCGTTTVIPNIPTSPVNSVPPVPVMPIMPIAVSKRPVAPAQVVMVSQSSSGRRISNIHSMPKVNSPLAQSLTMDQPPARTDNDFNLPVHNIFQGPTPMMIDNPNMNMMDEDGNYDGSDRRGTRPKLNINIPENTNTSANMVGAANKVHLVEKLQNLALGSPRFHRRKPANEPTNMPSPVITSTPKRSWFANLFNFKPDNFTLHSIHSYEETYNYLVARLLQYEVKYQLRREGNGFKCKYEIIESHTASPSSTSPHSPNVFSTMGNVPNNTSAAKSLSPPQTLSSPVASPPATVSGYMSSEHDNGSHGTFDSLSGPTSPSQVNSLGAAPTSPNAPRNVKFKIEVVANEDPDAPVGQFDGGRTWKVVFSLQQGAYTLFQEVVEKFRNGWELNR